MLPKVLQLQARRCSGRQNAAHTLPLILLPRWSCTPVTVEPKAVVLTTAGQNAFHSLSADICLEVLSNRQPFLLISVSLFGWTWNEFIP